MIEKAISNNNKKITTKENMMRLETLFSRILCTSVGIFTKVNKKYIISIIAVLLTGAAAVLCAALRGIFSSVCSLSRVERVDGGQAQDFGRVFGFGILGVLILVLLMAFSAGSMHAAAWAHKKQITINAAKVPSTQTNFPVLISITDIDLRDDAQDDGDDICFTTNPDETNPANRLSHEIEYFDGVTTGKLVAWVKIPSLSGSSDTNIYMHYGNLTCSSMQDATGVWDSNFKGVWHLKEDPSGTAPQMIDSTSDDNDGTSGGSMTSGDQVSAKVDGGLDFDGSNDYINVPDDDTLDMPNSLTYEAWTYPLSWGNWHQIFRKSNDIKMESNADGRLGFTLNRVVGGETEVWTPIGVSPWPLNEWSYVVWRRDETNMKIFVNGVEKASTACSGTLKINTAALTISVANGGSGAFDGIIDEARISNTARSGDWITTCYNNQSDQTVGSDHFIKAVGSETDSSLPVELSIFFAQYLNNVPTLYWVTQSETDNIGWFIYRNIEEDFTTAERITDYLIEGYGTTTEPHSYIYKDVELNGIQGESYWYWIESVDLGGAFHRYDPKVVTIPNIPEDHSSPVIPKQYGLHQNDPNPLAGGSTKISFLLPKTARAEIKIYNIRGELVKDLYKGVAYTDDEVKLTWDGRDENGTLQSTGIYLYQLKVNGKVYETKRLIVIR